MRTRTDELLGPTRTNELLGRAGGVALAPATATLSAVRHARMFHPRGVVLRAEVDAIADHAPWLALAARLDGRAIVRLSSAWWKTREWPDVLGCAIRFTRSRELDAQPRDGDQDLLLATIRRPWTMPFAPLSTRQHDFLANHYFAVSPFRAEPAGVIEWRLVPEAARERRGTRAERLASALSRGEASFVLEARPYRRVIDVVRHRRWTTIARITLREPLELDDDSLRFDPFRAGRGIEPVGFVHSLRIAAYGASRWAWPGRVAR